MARATYKRKRMALFAKSYAGYFFKNYFNTTENVQSRGKQIKRLTQILGFEPKYVNNLQIRQQSAFTKDLCSIKIYIAIEKEMIKVFEHRSDGYSFILEDYGYALLEPALERVAGNDLSNTADAEFETKLLELKAHYRYIYYFVANKYKLPTINNLAFILRLITP